MTIGPSEATITDPTGHLVDLVAGSPNETLTRGSNNFARVISFDVRISGTYTISIQSESTREVIVSEELSSVFPHVIGWLIAGFVSLLGILAGVIFLVRGRRQARRVR